MMQVEVVQDSYYKPLFGRPVRITSVLVEYPRFVHAQVLTHRAFSRNSSSSRAIPVIEVIKQTKTNPVYPSHWGAKQSGMQAEKELGKREQHEARLVWQQAARSARLYAQKLDEIGVHKQVTNRLLEPYQHIKVLITATDWDNFFALREHHDTQPETQLLAVAIKQAMDTSQPLRLKRGEWHLPFVDRERHRGQMVYSVDGDVITLAEAKRISASAAAQTSYRKADLGWGKADAIYQRLVESRPVHASPFEHQGTPLLFGGWRRSRNFRGWKQLRAEIPFDTVRG
ncbi:thymidylate synthase ThyX [Oceanisphaera litoralis]|uniref:FAD-dependent thymidylate synthase n=1 Tax=Oceanisphaera litoralis TaxID=225144 RepID=UPI001959300B|nr:FAD-dependent thymidylate synthase [Oceanisphaera litoralis]MBM7454528.1 thymidylate synthase ThyX [Oceanisphaera litoralis]